MKDDRKESYEQRAQVHHELRSIKEDVVEIRRDTSIVASTVRHPPDPVNLRELVPHFSEYDRRLALENTNAGIAGSLDGVGRIVCFELGETDLGHSFPRVVHVYCRIAARVNVQGFYGILEKSGRNYAIMEDLSTDMTLDDIVQVGTLPSLPARLRVALELANTMAFLHRAGLLLKSLSGTTVVLKMINGEIRPVITDLESARLVGHLLLDSFNVQIIELTSSIQYDPRYEAPEYQNQHIHTLATDIWRYNHPLIQ